MKITTIIFLLIFLGSCSNSRKLQPPIGMILNQHYYSAIDAKFPLILTKIDFQDTTRVIKLNDEIESKIKTTVQDYYFNDCGGDTSETYFTIKDTYINSVRLHDSLQTIYFVLLKHISGNINSKILFYDNSTKSFSVKTLDFNIHGLYDFVNGKLTPTNLKTNFRIEVPEIELLDFDKDGSNEFKFTRLYHNGTDNAIETTIIKVSNSNIVNTRDRGGLFI